MSFEKSWAWKPLSSAISRDALMEGISLRGERIPLWSHQKRIFKAAALGRSGAALSIQTSVESPYADVHDAESGLRVLGALVRSD